MKIKKGFYVLLICAMAISCLIVPAGAADVSDENVVNLNDLAWEWIDLENVTFLEEGVTPLTTSSINKNISGHALSIEQRQFSLQAGDTVTINCSYSPSPASVDFGLVTSDGKFYSVNVKGGSINQTFEISQSGSYTVAIRNNTSQTISVVGFVDY